VRRHAKASSAGSTWTTDCAAGRGRFLLVLLSTFALCLILGAGGASAKTYAPGTPASFCAGTGTAAGECGEIRGVAVDSSNGHVYAFDQGNHRINEFLFDGTFVRAFGSGVATGAAGPEVCTTTCLPGLETGPGSIVGARGIAVDPETHVVYAVAAGDRLVYYNGTSGAFLATTNALGAGAPEGFVNLGGVAVDSSGPQHYLYVAFRPGVAPAISKIDKFSITASGVTAGSYVCQILGTAVDTSVNSTECGNPTPGIPTNVPAHKNGIFEGIDTGTGPTPGQPGGNLAVDASGNVFVGEKIGNEVGGLPDRHYISEFAKTGDFVTQFKPCCGSPALTTNTPRPAAIATLPSGNLLVAAGIAPNVRIQEYNPASPGAPLTEFGLGTIGNSAGVATFGPHAVVADRVNKNIWKFTATVEAPSASTEAATELTKSKATLGGKVNPNLGNVTDCHFDYGVTVTYGSTAPCVPSPGGGFEPVSVSAQLTGLAPGTVYHVRLVATNSVGTTNGNDVTFETALVNNPEAITTAGATQIAQTTAKVAGKVNPNEVQVTDCHFNYGTTTAYGSTAPCVPANPGSGGALVDVSATLTGLDPKTTYHFQLEATNGDGTSKGADQSFTTLPDPPTLTTPLASEITQISAEIDATVNPNGANVSDCRIEYGTTTAYGSQKACVPSPGSGTSAVDVGATLSGLTAGTPYHFRLRATNSGGTSTGPDQSFITLPPLVPFAATDGSSAGLEPDLVSLEGRVNPKGLPVLSCRFVYGPTSDYGESTPCVPSAVGLGNGNSEIAVTASTEPLEPNTTYHFRLVASNLQGDGNGKERIFVTGPASADDCPNAAIRAEQGIKTLRLPDCMALEQVSPARKGNQDARLAGGLAGAFVPRVSVDGGRIVFNSTATIGTCANLNAINGDYYVAARQSGSWSAECGALPYPIGKSGLNPESFTPDLSGSILRGEVEGGIGFYRRDLGIATPLSPPLPFTNGSPSNNSLVGASRDHSHMFFASSNNPYLPGDPTPAGEGRDLSVYVAQRDPEGQPSLRLLPRDRNGKVWGGSCGSRLGGVGEEVGSAGALTSRDQGAVSADGSRAYFSTRPSQPPSGDCDEANKMRIMVREETVGGAEVEELVASECDRVSPPCSTADSDDLFQGASVDQTKVYFVSGRQLADSDRDAAAGSCRGSGGFNPIAGCDLYLYDTTKPAGERLTQVSAGEELGAGVHETGKDAKVLDGIAAISADGSHVYFVAAGVLTAEPNPEGDTAVAGQPNLFAWDVAAETTAFIGTLDTGDGGGFLGLWGGSQGAYPVPQIATDAQGREVGGDGHVLLLRSRASLENGDSDGGKFDVYRYDADSHELVRISQAAAGGSDNGPFDAGALMKRTIGTDYAVSERPISEDGETVVFTSTDGLMPGDVNGVEDLYMWRKGQLYRLPGSARAVVANAGVVSPDGSTVAYHTSAQVLPSDGDKAIDVYVARVNGGYPAPPPAEVCAGEACQGPPAMLSGSTGATSSFFQGAGNVSGRGVKKCPKGTVRRHGKCVKKKKHVKHRRQRTRHQRGDAK
jgi:hypothetical protein